MAELVLKDVVLKYFGETALNIDYLKAPLPLGISGWGGSGKTNLIKVIAGLEQIEKGEIFVDGLEIGGLKPLKRNMSLLSKDTPLFLNKSVYDNLNYPLKKHKIGVEEAYNRIMAAQKVLNIDLSLKAKELNNEQRADLLILRSNIKNPAVILIDEPEEFCFAPVIYFDKRIKELLPLEKIIYASYDFDRVNDLCGNFITLKKGVVINFLKE